MILIFLLLILSAQAVEETMYRIFGPGETVRHQLKGTSIVNLIMNHIGHVVYEISAELNHSGTKNTKRNERYSGELKFEKFSYLPPTDDVTKYGFLILGIFEGRGSSTLTAIPELPFNISFSDLTPQTKIYLTYQTTPEVMRAFNGHIFHGEYAERDVTLPKWFAVSLDFHFIRLSAASDVGRCR